MDEFNLIEYFFNRNKRNRADVIRGIGDDAALLMPPPEHCLVATIDTLLNKKHFLQNTPPKTLGHKALAVNLSDLAAMGAEPAWILLALTLPTADETWLAEFSKGFFTLLRRFKCQLVGGDLTCGPLSITIQALGFVPERKALLRDNAKIGDHIYVTGTLGDAGLALAYLQKKISLNLNAAQKKILLDRLNCPEPRIAMGLALRDIANSAIDISDGLAADLEHILTASQVGGIIYLDRLPFSHCLAKLPRKKAWQFALNAGDDYELCFTAPKLSDLALQQLAKTVGCRITCIGIITKEKGLFFSHSDASFRLETKGFQHFGNMKKI
jgi:thiamine-monophosphate kinase